MSKKYVIAIPKGRILEELLPILQNAGIQPADNFFEKKDRSLKFATNLEWLDIIRVRSFDAATFVAYGAAQIGVAGSDVLEEFNYSNIFAPLDLDIGHCRLSVAAPSEIAGTEDPKQWSHIRVATKYPHITRRYFSERGVRAECIKLNGAMELAPSLGLSQHIVDLVSTGSTLKANDLTEIEPLMDVSSRLIVNRAAFKTDDGTLKTLIEKFEKAVVA